MLRSILLILLAVTACRRADETPIGNDPAGDTARDSIDTVSAPFRDSSAEKTCGVTTTGPIRLEENGIGELKQGRPVSYVAGLCEVLSDSEQRGVEGMMERVLVVRIAGETVRSVVTDDRIFRIEINSPRFRTADSLGVDTPLRRIAAMRGAQFAPGEDGVYGFSSDHCGLSFRFSVPWRPPAGGQWTAQQIVAEHGDAAVNRVIVIPCRR